MPEQTFKNHTRFDPRFHFFLMPLLLVCFVMSIVHAVHEATPANRLLIPLSFGVLFTALLARMYALQNQDRVIRLEETVRLHRLGGDPSGLGIKQVVALRFASDAELPALALRARSEGMTPAQIKAAVTHWRADTERI